METEPICPSCRKTLPPGTPLGLCPECLIKSGFNTGTEPGRAGKDSGFVPPPVEELRQLFPQLEIIELIGRGGMGAVYKARQPALDRYVALKILPPGAADDAGYAGRFNREARALARLSHPHIVAVHDFGQVTGQPYLIMEFVDGANLRQVEQAGRLAPEQALEIVPQICEALQFAHNEGIVHRDIKPENILINKKGRVKITDFGIAKILGANSGQVSLTGAKDIVGTPHYMAPEQVEKPSNVDHRADIYSLGVVFYEMLTGELPLGKFAPPSRKVHVDVRLDEVVLRTLEKEPELRYQQASEVKTQVETIATSAGSSGRESGPPGAQPARSALATMRYNPWEVNITVLGTIFFVVAFCVALNLPRPALPVILCAVGLIICALTWAGIWPFPSPFFPEPNFSSRNLRRENAASSSRVTEPRLSRTAILGVVWAVLFFMALAILPALMVYYPVPSRPPAEGGAGVQRVVSARFLLLLSPFWLVALAAPFGTTILGWTAVSQIRRLAGRVYGLGLAVFDGLLFPLLALDAFVFGVIHALTGNVFQGDYLAIALLVSFVFDWRIAWWVWKAVNKPSSGFPASSGTPPNIGRSMGSRGVAKPVLLHAIALLAGVAFFAFVVPLFAAKYANWGAPLPKETLITLHFSEFVRNGGALLLPVLLVLVVVDLGICFLLQRFTNRTLIGVWSYAVLVALVVPVAVGMWGVFSPLTRFTKHSGSGESAANPSALRRLSTAEVIQAGLAKPDSPWAWQELEQRAKAGRLDTAEAGALLNQLTIWMRRSYPNGYDQPLHWLRGLLDELGKRHLVTDEKMLAFLDAFYGKAKCEPLLRMRENDPESGMSLTCRWRSPWTDDLFGLKLLNEMRSITIDGKEANWRNVSPNCEQYEFYGYLELPALAAGKHSVRFEIESALIPKDDLVGLAPDTMSEDWPSAKRRWTRVCEAELIVYPESAEIVNLTEDPALDPVATGALSIKQVIIRSDSKGPTAAVAVVVLEKDNTGQKLLVPISFDVALRVGGETYRCGRFWSAAKGTRGRFTPNSGSRSELSADIKRLGPEVREAEVVLTPNPKAVEKQGSIDRIWGRNIVFPHVRLVRQDLREADQPYFGPVIERVVNDVSIGRDCFLNLETGELLSPVEKLTKPEEMQVWAIKHEADLVAYQQGVPGAQRGLMLLCGISVNPPDWGWGDAIAESVLKTAEEIERGKANRPVAASYSPMLPGRNSTPSYVFKTCQGRVGILQILALTESPRGVKIRYKLVEGAGGASASSSQPTAPSLALQGFDAGIVAEGFLGALARGDLESARKLTTTQYQEVHRLGLENLVETIDLARARGDYSAVSAEDAAVVSTWLPVKGRDGKVALGIGLCLVDHRWRIRDLDELPNEKAKQKYLNGFRRRFPNANPPASADAAPGKVNFGPVIEREFRSNVSLDFDSGRITTDWPGSATQPERSIENALPGFDWLKKEGFELAYILRERPWAMGMKVEELGHEDWERLGASELEVLLGAVRETETKRIQVLAGFWTPYGFQTRGGHAGIMQVALFDGGHGVKLRYKLAQNAAAKPAANSDSTSAAGPPESVFERVVQRVLEASGEDEGFHGLDLENGSFATGGPDIFTNQELKRQMFAKHGVDLLALDKGDNNWELVGLETTLAPIPEEQRMRPYSEHGLRQLLEATRMVKRDGWRVQAVQSDGEKPPIFAVLTSSGAIGTLQIMGSTNNPRGLKLSYRLGRRTRPPPLDDAVKAIQFYGGFVKTNADGRVFRVSMVYDIDEQGRRVECNDNSDQFAEWLLAFPELQELWLKEHQVTDRTMQFVRRLHELKMVMLWDAHLLTDEGVRYLADLKQLETLHIDKSRIDDQALALLAELPKLKSLALQENHFTDKGMPNLARMTQLTNLWIGIGSVVTDRGLVSLGGLTNLEQLELSRCPITDDGLPHLRGLKKLRRLYLNGTETTEEGRAQLKAAIPGLEIQPNP